MITLWVLNGGVKVTQWDMLSAEVTVCFFSSRDSPRTLSSILSGEGLYEVERGGSQAKKFPATRKLGLSRVLRLQFPNHSFRKRRAFYARLLIF
jgi:hypothetical protein